MRDDNIYSISISMHFQSNLIQDLFQRMSSKRKSHPMKILSDNQLYPSNKPWLPDATQQTQLFPNFPILTHNFLPSNETEEMTEPQSDPAESAEASEMTNTKSNNDSNVPSHREAMNQILKKLALKSQENLKKSKEESTRQVFIGSLFDQIDISLHNPSGH